MKPSAAVLLATIVVLILITSVRSDDCGSPESVAHDRARARHFKLAAVYSYLVCCAVGLCVNYPAFQPDGDTFLVVKAFAAGVILATGLIHILPDAFEKLTSPCLPAARPWKDFPFAGLGAMVGAMGMLIFDTVVTGCFTRAHEAATRASSAAVGDEGNQVAANTVASEEGGQHLHVVRTYTTHGHARGSAALVRVISQVHSAIIGISLGASQDPDTIIPLGVALSFHQLRASQDPDTIIPLGVALSFHQLLESMSLSAYLLQAQITFRSTQAMIIYICVTTPVGILVGLGISQVYKENNQMVLVGEGILNSLAAGILFYKALVVLLAEDFMKPKVQRRGMLQLGLTVAMLLGAGLIAILAKWV